MLALPDLSSLSLGEPTGAKKTLKQRKEQMDEIVERLRKRVAPRVPIKMMKYARWKVVRPKSIRYNLVFNNCVDFALEIFGHIADCSLGMRRARASVPIQVPGACHVKRGVPKEVAIDIEYNSEKDEELGNFFIETGVESYISGFEQLYYALKADKLGKFEAYLIQIYHTVFNPRGKLTTVPGDVNKAIAHWNGHTMVGLKLYKKYVRVNQKSLELVDCEPYGFVFGASPDDAWLRDPETNQPQVPIRGKGYKQMLMLNNRMSVNAPDMLPDAEGEGAKKKLTFKVEAYYDPAVPETKKLHNKLITVLEHLLNTSTDPYPDWCDNSHYQDWPVPEYPPPDKPTKANIEDGDDDDAVNAPFTWQVPPEIAMCLFP